MMRVMKTFGGDGGTGGGKSRDGIGIERVQRAVARRSRAWQQEWQLWLDRRRGRRIVHFLHVGKTGGTAVKEALRPHRRGPEHHLLLHGHATTLADVPAGENFVFFLREPVSRFVSGFRSRQRQGLPRHDVPWSDAERVAFERFSEPEDLALALYHPDAELREAAAAAMRSIQHVRDDYGHWFGTLEMFRRREHDILHVGFQETLDRDFSLLRNKLGLPATVTLPGDDLRAHRDPRGKGALEPLGQEARARLADWYATDVAFYEYCLERFGGGEA